MDTVIQFLHTLIALAVQIFTLVVQIIVAILSFFLMLAQMVLTALHLS